MPAFPIVDAHVHFYDVERLKYSWLTGFPKLNRTHLPADFDAARGEVEVERIVFVEVDVDPGLHLQEAAFVEALADRDPRIGAIVAHAPLEKGAAVEADLAALSKMKRVRGVRRLIQSALDPSFCIAPDFLEAVRLLPKYGLSFDICIRHFQLAYAIELVRRCPQTAFILDHIGKPDIKYGLVEPWASQMRELARLPNVVCKVSGVITEADHARWTPDQVKPYIETAIDAFGFERVMFGGDWCVSSLTHAYPAFIAILDEILAQAKESERRRFYRDNAMRAYRIA